MDADSAFNNAYILGWEYRLPIPHPHPQIPKYMKYKYRRVWVQVWRVRDATQCISCSLSVIKRVIKVQMVGIYLTSNLIYSVPE